MKQNKINFLKLVSEKDTKTLKEVRWRIKNRWYLRIIQNIHLTLLTLRDKILKTFY